MRVQLVHWKTEEGGVYLDLLQKAAFQTAHNENFSATLRKIRELSPAAVVIDLSRLPAHGREAAIALRQSARTNRIPIVFCEGSEEKVAKIRDVLPDAHYCKLTELATTLKRALRNPVLNPIKPAQMMDRYASRTAAQKLGIEAEMHVRVVDPPRDYFSVLGELPRGVEFFEDEDARGPVTLCFFHSAATLPATVSRVRRFARNSRLWFLWRKGGRSPESISGSALRACANGLGLVDYKICSVDKTWSAMLFAMKR